MLEVKYEGIPNSRYSLDPAIVTAVGAAVAAAQKKDSGLGLLTPLGQLNSELLTGGFVAGQIATLKDDGSGNTVVALSTGAAAGAAGYPVGILADSFSDVIKIGISTAEAKVTFYEQYGSYETDAYLGSASAAADGGAAVAEPAVGDKLSANTGATTPSRKGKLIKVGEADAGATVVAICEQIAHNTVGAKSGEFVSVITVRLLSL